MESKSVLILIILISLLSIKCIDPCSTKQNVTRLGDCLNTTTTYYNSVCCLRTIYTSEGKELSCVPMNVKNKTSTIRYYYNGVTGILSCRSKILEMSEFKVILLIFMFIFLYI